jgi:transposase-like protein
MMRSVLISFGSTAGQMAFGVRAAIALPWPVMVEMRPSRTGSAIAVQRYRCKDCEARFDDLTGTILAGHHRPLRTWVLGLYFMGLNLSNRQIAQELDLSVSDVQAMTEQLRCGLVAKIPPVTLDGEVEVDEVYVVAGPKGNPAAVAKKTALDAAVGSKEPPAGGHWRKKSRQFSA